MSDETGTDAPHLVKCLVWDLDNTLWQGTLLEDDGGRLPDAIRDVIVELDARGILQSVCSRNDHDLAWARLEKLGIAEYFVLPEIGWGRKSEAVGRIADGLDFALAPSPSSTTSRPSGPRSPSTSRRCAAIRPRMHWPSPVCPSSAPPSIPWTPAVAGRCTRPDSGGTPNGPPSPGPTRTSCAPSTW